MVCVLPPPPLCLSVSLQLSPKDSVNEDGSVRQEFFKPRKARRGRRKEGRRARLCWECPPPTDAARARLRATPAQKVVFVVDKKWGEAEKLKLYEARHWRRGARAGREG